MFLIFFKKQPNMHALYRTFYLQASSNLCIGSVSSLLAGMLSFFRASGSVRVSHPERSSHMYEAKGINCHFDFPETDLVVVWYVIYFVSFCLNLGLANHNQWTNSSPLPAFIKKSFIGMQTHQVFACCLWATAFALSWQRWVVSKKVIWPTKILTI